VPIARKERAQLADTSHVDEHKKVEEWADALLDQHRTAPRKDAARAIPAGDSGSTVDGLLVPLSTKLGGQPPDPEMLERLRRRRESFAFLARIEPVVTFIGIVVMCALAYATFSVF
jgi:hypothetical protein